MIPGEILPAAGELTLNEGADVTRLMVANTGDRPVQVGSHYHFAETNPGLSWLTKRSLEMTSKPCCGSRRAAKCPSPLIPANPTIRPIS